MSFTKDIPDLNEIYERDKDKKKVNGEDKTPRFERPEYWQRYDVKHVANWDCPPLAWLVGNIFPKGDFSTICADSQIGKSILMQHLSVKFVIGGSFLSRWEVCSGNKVFYLALEDPPRRIKERLLDQESDFEKEKDVVIKNFEDSFYESALPENSFVYEVWPGFSLMKEQHTHYLRDLVLQEGFNVVIIDTLQSGAPGVSSNQEEEMNYIYNSLRTLSHQLNVAVIIVDHLRKEGTEKRKLSIASVPGNRVKVANTGAVFLMQEYERKKNSVVIECLSKAKDGTEMHFLFEKFDKGSGEEKYKFVEDISVEAATIRKEKKEQKKLSNKKLVLNYLRARKNSAIGKATIATDQKLSLTETREALEYLCDKKHVKMVGSGRSTKYMYTDQCVELIEEDCDKPSEGEE